MGEQMLVIGVVVHPIDTATHPTIPEGWRWACYLGEDWANIDSCLNAGWAASEIDAAISGEAAGVCAVKVAQLLAPGIEVSMPTTVLAADPVAAEVDWSAEVVDEQDGEG